MLTPQQKRLLVLGRLSQPDAAPLSDRQIARELGVSQPFVSALRRHGGQVHRPPLSPDHRKRTDRIPMQPTAQHSGTSAVGNNAGSTLETSTPSGYREVWPAAAGAQTRPPRPFVSGDLDPLGAVEGPMTHAQYEADLVRRGFHPSPLPGGWARRIRPAVDEEDHSTNKHGLWDPWT